MSVAVGVNTDGQREVLGLKVDASEAEPFWIEFLRSLKMFEENDEWSLNRRFQSLKLAVGP